MALRSFSSSRTLTRRITLIGAAACVLATFANPIAAKTAITVEEQAVTARVTRGATTAWFAIVHERAGYRPRIVDHARLLVDDDGDGIVRYPYRATDSSAVWLVVDLTDGSYAAVGRGQYPLRRRPLTPAMLSPKGNASKARVLHALSSILVWVVRPGVGAWVAEVEDGAAEDGDDSPNGKVAALLENMIPVGSSPAAPADFQRDDVVAIVDPYELDLFDGRVSR